MTSTNTKLRLRHIDEYTHPSVQTQRRLEVIRSYAEWVGRLERYGRDGEIYYASHVTLMFRHIPGDFRRKYSVMSDEADRFYKTFIRHVVHNARSQKSQRKLPLWPVVPDLPKDMKSSFPEFRLNDGLHLNGPMLIPINTRMRETLWMHVQPEAKYYHEYVRPDRPLLRIHVEPIEFSPERMTDYAMKTLKFKIPDLDCIQIFPKSISELPE
jgi:hypothetical protein